MSRRVVHLPLPKKVQDFRTTQAWYLYPQQTRPTLVPARQQPPASWTPIDGASVAPPAQNFVFPVQQPVRRLGYRLGTKIRSVSGDLPSVSAKQPFTYVIHQPDRRAFYLEPIRYQVPTVVRLETQIPIPTPPYDLLAPFVQPRASAFGWPQTVMPWTPIAGPPAAAPNTQIYKLDVAIPLYYTERPKPRLIVRIVQGLSRNTQDPIRHVQDQPTSRWWTIIGRPRAEPAVPIGGASVQPTFLYPTDQPPPAWYVRRLAQFVAPEPRHESTSRQPTYLYPVDQPVAARYPAPLQLPITVRVVDAAGAATIQSDTWQGHVRPPVFTIRLDINRLGPQGAVPQFTGAAPQAPQLYTFNTLQPHPAARLAGWTPWLWPALQAWMSTFGPPPVTVQASFVTWNAEGTILVTWQLLDGSVVTWNMEPNDLITWRVN